MNRLTLEAVQPDSLRKVYEQGWRPTLMLYGGVGIAIALLYWIVARDWPVQHPWCNSAERELIAEQTLARPVSDSSGKSPSVPFPWRAVLTSQSLWLMSIMQFGTNIGWVFLITSLPAYLSEVHKVPLAERGWMQTIPLTMGILGTFVGGHLTDWLVGRLGLRWGRMAQVMVTRLFCVLAFAACPFLTDPWAVTIAMSIVAFSVDLGVAPTWAFMQDVGGRSAGSILGWANMWGNLGAAVSPMLISLVLEQTNRNWTAVFALCAAGFVMALICGFGVDARKPIAPPA